MTHFAALSLLQAAAPGAGGFPPGLQLVIQFGLILAIFYFLMIRPQQKQRRQHEAALRSLKPKDEIVTSGGIVGTVVHIRETKSGDVAKPMEDQITIRSGESRLVVERGRIARIITAGARADTAKADAAPPAAGS